MRQPKLIDYALLTILSLIWASAFFNIKIATYSFGPVTIAFLGVAIRAGHHCCQILHDKLNIPQCDSLLMGNKCGAHTVP